MDGDTLREVVLTWAVAGFGLSAGWHGFVMLANLLSAAFTGLGNLISPPEDT
jgi:hypothetical protein